MTRHLIISLILITLYAVLVYLFVGCTTDEWTGDVDTGEHCYVCNEQPQVVQECTGHYCGSPGTAPSRIPPPVLY